VFERRVLRRIFEPKREEVAGCWRGLHIKGLASLIIVRVFKSRRMRGAGHVACMGEMRNACRICQRT
jgi:hypothetical protein